jgi:hypothetical protein
MKKFDRIDLKLQDMIAEFEAFKTLVDSNDSIDESVLLRFFKERPNFVCLIGGLGLPDFRNDLFASELDLFGYFRADFAVGNLQSGEYLLIELESATDNIYRQQGSKSKREWHSAFNNGYNQLIDWFWLLEDFEHTKNFEELFENFQSFTGLLIIGRDKYLTEEEQRRLKWRQNKSLFDSNRILIMTYDEVYERLHQYVQHLITITSNPTSES